LNSGQASYTFTLVLNQCGTQFIDELGSGGQAYLENTIVIQMEEGIQEVRFSNFWSLCIICIIYCHLGLFLALLFHVFSTAIMYMKRKNNDERS